MEKVGRGGRPGCRVGAQRRAETTAQGAEIRRGAERVSSESPLGPIANPDPPVRLRRRTRNNVWQRREDARHEHTWEEYPTEDPNVVSENGMRKVRRVCADCGFEIDVEVL